MKKISIFGILGAVMVFLGCASTSSSPESSEEAEGMSPAGDVGGMAPSEDTSSVDEMMEEDSEMSSPPMMDEGMDEMGDETGMDSEESESPAEDSAE